MSNKGKYVAEYYGKKTLSFFKKLIIVVGVLLLIAATVVCFIYFPGVYSKVMEFVFKHDFPVIIRYAIQFFPITGFVLFGIVRLISGIVSGIVRSIKSCKKYVGEKTALEVPVSE